jgi:hypothetical protein
MAVENGSVGLRVRVVKSPYFSEPTGYRLSVIRYRRSGERSVPTHKVLKGGYIGTLSRFATALTIKEFTQRAERKLKELRRAGQIAYPEWRFLKQQLQNKIKERLAQA